jgi:hypothetical protein
MGALADETLQNMAQLPQHARTIAIEEEQDHQHQQQLGQVPADATRELRGLADMGRQP